MELDLARSNLIIQARTTAGGICPCCNKFAKIYKRKLNSNLSRSLIYCYPMFMKYPGRPLQIGEYCVKRHRWHSGEHGKGQWWGFLKRSERDFRLYRLTEKGASFIRGDIRVPKYVTEYNSEILEFSEETTDIKEALGDHFNYYELMKEPL